MAVSDDSLLLLHAADGEQWANFIATRLNSPQYKIRSVLRNFSTPDNVEPCSLDNSFSTNSTDECDSTRNRRTNAGKGDHRLTNASYRDSGRSSHSTFSEFSSISDCLSGSRASVVFLSPDTMSSNSFPFDVAQMNPRRSVFLFLGVDIEEVRAFFGEKSGCVFKCRCCLIDVDELSVSDALVQIIEAYEDPGDSSLVGDDDDDDDSDVYNVPGCPRQLNRIEKVFPRELTEKAQDVYILLERAAEEEVFVVFTSAAGRRLPLVCVCERLYRFVLPDNASGEICFKVECQNHCIGEESIQVLTKLDCLKAILTETVDPLAILASALGLASDDLGGIDTTLAFKLQQLAPALTFDKLFPCEEALNNSIKDDRADVLYPSLLHFAADLNLRTFCSELLRFPGMLTACLTENCEGEYPSQIASRKGYTHLESDLLRFVEDQKRESELYVSPTSRLPSFLARPKPHSRGKQPCYMNEEDTRSVASGLYIEMGNVHLSTDMTQDKNLEPADTDFVSPTSASSDSPLLKSFSSEDDVNQMADHSNLSLSELSLQSDPRSSTTMSSKARKLLGVNEDVVSSQGTLAVASAHIRSEGEVTSGPAGISVASCSHPQVTQMLSEPIRSCFRHNSQEPIPNEPDSKLRTLAKIVSFFGKIKSKRSNSIGDNTSVSSRTLKKSLSNRSDKSNKSSVETNSHSTKKKPDPAYPERDSGSYSDEDKEKSWSSSFKKMSKPKEFKDKGKPLIRRLSQRAQAARTECVRDAPELPSAVAKKESWTDLNGNH